MTQQPGEITHNLDSWEDWYRNYDIDPYSVPGFRNAAKRQNYVPKSVRQQKERELKSASAIPNVTDFWFDPRRVGLFHTQINLSTPPDAEFAEWITPEFREQLEAAYDYYDDINDGEYWWNWDIGPNTDWGEMFLGQISLPPAEVLQQDWEKYYKYYDDQAAAVQAPEEPVFAYSGLTPEEFGALPKWKQTLYNVLASVGGTSVATGPEGEEIKLTAAQFAALPEEQQFLLPIFSSPSVTGVSIGLVTGGLPGAAAGGIIGTLAAAFPEVQNVLKVMDIPYQILEQSLGTFAQMTHVPEEDRIRIAAQLSDNPLENIKQILDGSHPMLDYLEDSWSKKNLEAMWASSRLFYESMGPEAIATTSAVAHALTGSPGSLLELPGELKEITEGDVEAWQFGTADTWMLSPENRDVHALYKVTQDILDGKKPPEQIINEYAAQFGAPGTVTDLMGAIFLDPLNVVAPLLNDLLQIPAKVANDDLLLRSIRDNDGPLASLKSYRKQVPQILDVSQAENWGAFHRFIAGITDEGRPARFNVEKNLYEAVTPFGTWRYSKGALWNKVAGTVVPGAFGAAVGGIFGAPVAAIGAIAGGLYGFKKGFGYFANLTPVSQAMESLRWSVDNATVLANVGTTAEEINSIIKGIASNPLTVAAQYSMQTLKSHIGGVTAASLKDFDYKVLDDLLDVYEGTKTQRAILENLARVTMQKPIDVLFEMQKGDTEALLRRYVEKARLDGSPAAKSIVNAFDAGKLTPDTMTELLKVFLTDNNPWDLNSYKAAVVDAMHDHIEKWAAKYYGIEQDPAWLRAARVMKSAQAVALMGWNPIYLINNFVNNVVTMAYDGGFGITRGPLTMKGMENFWGTVMGFVPTKVRQGVGVEGMIHPERIYNTRTGAIYKAVEGEGGLINKLGGYAKTVNDKLGLFTNKSAEIEAYSSARMMTAEFMNSFENLWTPGRGFDHMDFALENALGPDAAARVRDAVQSGRTKAEIANILYSESVYRPLNAVLDEIAPSVNMTGDMLRQELNKIGAVDSIKELLKDAKSDLEVSNAFDQFFKETEDFIDDLSQEAIRDEYAKYAGEVSLEGVSTIAKNLGRHYIDWLFNRYADYIENEKAANAPLGIRGIEWWRTFMSQDARWTRWMERLETHLTAFADSVNLGDDISKQLRKDLVDYSNIYREFYNLKRSEYTEFFRMSNANEFKNGTEAKKYFVEMQKRISQHYNEVSVPKEIEYNQRINGYIQDMFAMQYGDEIRPLVKDWFDSMMLQRKKMTDGMKKFHDERTKAFEAGEKPPDWQPFVDENISPLIAETAILENEKLQPLFEYTKSKAPKTDYDVDTNKVPPSTRDIDDPYEPNLPNEKWAKEDRNRGIYTPLEYLPDHIAKILKREAKSTIEDIGGQKGNQPGDVVPTEVEKPGFDPNEWHPYRRVDEREPWLQDFQNRTGISRSELYNHLEKIASGNDKPLTGRQYKKNQVKDLLYERILGNVFTNRTQAWDENFYPQMNMLHWLDMRGEAVEYFNKMINNGTIGRMTNEDIIDTFGTIDIFNDIESWWGKAVNTFGNDITAQIVEADRSGIITKATLLGELYGVPIAYRTKNMLPGDYGRFNTPYVLNIINKYGAEGGSIPINAENINKALDTFTKDSSVNSKTLYVKFKGDPRNYEISQWYRIPEKGANKNQIKYRTEIKAPKDRGWIRGDAFKDIADIERIHTGSETIGDVVIVFDGKPNLGFKDVAQATPEIIQRAFEQWAIDRTDGPLFKKWFGDSKVVDDKGKPLVVYHGTWTDFTGFDLSFSDAGEYGRGFYFSSDPEVASTYAMQPRIEDMSGGRDRLGNVIPVYLRMENPYTLPVKIHEQFGEIVDIEKFFEDTGLDWENGQQVSQGLRDKLIELGYDGFIEPFSGEYVAYYPNQVKSIFNPGTWDIKDPSILDLESAAYRDMEVEKILGRWRERINPEQPEAPKKTDPDFEPVRDPIRMPPGWAESQDPVGPWVQGIEENYYSRLKPALTTARDTLMGEGGKMRDFAHGQLDANTRKQLDGYLSKVYGQQADAKLAAYRHAEAKRDFSLLNYSNRTGFDEVMGSILPYSFWYTRTFFNWWTQRIVDKPQWFARYYRLKRFMDEQYQEGFPTRLQGKMRLPMPMPDWAGDFVYIDPWHQLFPFSQVWDSSPIARKQEEMKEINGQVKYVVGSMLSNNEYTPQQIQQALTTQQGALYEKIIEMAKMRTDAELDNPFSFLATISGPMLPLSWAYSAVNGDMNDQSLLPITRFVQSLTAWATPGGVNMEGPFRKFFGLEPNGRMHPYYINRELSNMVGNGEIDYDTAIRAMVEGQGNPNYMAALDRIGKERSLKHMFGWLWADIFPEGEQEQRRLKMVFDQYAEEGRLSEFWDEHPEYQARLALWDWENPEEQMKYYLRSYIWDKWHEMTPEDKDSYTEAFGDLFQTAFLNSETRSYDAIDARTMASWAQAIGMDLPKSDLLENVDRINVDRVPEEVQVRLDEYRRARESAIPGIDRILNMYYALPEGESRKQFRQYAPEIYRAWEFRDIWLAQNPDLIPYLVGKDNSLLDYTEEEQMIILNYRASEVTMWGDAKSLSIQYSAIPKENKSERRAFRDANPILYDYWDWQDSIFEQAPWLEDYVYGSGSEVSFLTENSEAITLSIEAEAIDVSTWEESLRFQTLGYLFGSLDLGTGTEAALRRQWESLGRPGGTFEEFLRILRYKFGLGY